MKRLQIGIGLFMALSLGTIVLTSAKPDNGSVTTEGKYKVVNTTMIGKDIRGYHGATPVKIYINKKNTIVKVEALKNRETPNVFKKAEALLRKFEGKSVKKASKLQVDAVTGATYSSNALIKNVKLGLKQVD